MMAPLTLDQILAHWQGHRNLTRRTIDAFPDDDSFANFTVGGMRPFAGLIKELCQMALPTVEGLSTGHWPWIDDPAPISREGALAKWDEITAGLDAAWPAVTAEQLQATHKAFGQWEMPGHGLLFYVIDNEVHHRGQGYVYLRALGVEPPAFPDRSLGGGPTRFR